MIDGRDDIPQVAHTDFVAAVSDSHGVWVLIEEVIDLGVFGGEIDSSEVSVSAIADQTCSLNGDQC